MGIGVSSAIENEINNKIETKTESINNNETVEVVDKFYNMKTREDINKFIIDNKIDVPHIENSNDILETITKLNFIIHQNPSVLIMQFKSFLTLYYFQNEKNRELFDETTRMFFNYYTLYTEDRKNKTIIDAKITKLIDDITRYLNRNEERDFDELRYEFNNYISDRFFKLYEEINYYLMNANEIDDVLVKYQSLLQMYFH